MVYGAFVARCKKLSKNFTIAHNDNFIKKNSERVKTEKFNFRSSQHQSPKWT